jgi:hypothetical protein
MRKKWLGWALVALGLGLALSTAEAQQAGDGARTSLIGQKIGGVYDVDSTFKVWRVGPTGIPYFNDSDRDRDFPLITQLFAGQQLTAGASFSMVTAVPLMQYTRAAIMLTWAAATADTDSIRIAVRVYGTTSSTSSNWHLWTPMTTTVIGNNAGVPVLDSCVMDGMVAADSGLGGRGRCLKPVSFWVGRSTGTGTEWRPRISTLLTSLYQGASIGGSGAFVAIRKIPSYNMRWGSANGVMLNLTDQSGAPCPFPYIRIEVYNCSANNNSLAGGAAGTITNVEANLWPRVQ